MKGKGLRSRRRGRRERVEYRDPSADAHPLCLFTVLVGGGSTGKDRTNVDLNPNHPLPVPLTRTVVTWVYPEREPLSHPVGDGPRKDQRRKGLCSVLVHNTSLHLRRLYP